MTNIFQEIWNHLNVVLLWVSIILLPFACWLLISTEKKYRAKKKQLEKVIHKPGMEDVRFLLKSKLEEHDIKVDNHQHERN